MPRTRLRRPRSTVAALATIIVLGAGAALLAGCAQPKPRVNTVGSVDFNTPLQLPPLDAGTRASDGTRVFDLVAQRGLTSFLPGEKTPTAGYGTPGHPNAYLGPTLVADRGAIGA